VRRSVVTAALLAAALLAACARPPAVQRLWEEGWERRRVGPRWAAGVSGTSERRFEVAHEGLRLRATLLNGEAAPARVTVGAPGGESAIVVPPHARTFLDVALERGEHALAADPAVLVSEPRLVRPGDDAEVVVLVLVDALRDDAVGERLMPATLAALGPHRRFADVAAGSTWTLPAVGSLFTGLPVWEIAMEDGSVLALPPVVPTWAAALDRAGFSGAASVGNLIVHELNGFARGFSSYAVRDAYDAGSGLPEAGGVVAEAAEWLAAHAGERAFVYLHLMDTHEPYHDHDAPILRAADLPAISGLSNGSRRPGEGEAERRRALYEREVRAVDAALAPFLASLPRNATVALTADHGEAFGERGAWGHGYDLYRETLQVPLLLRAPRVPAGVDREPRRAVDLAATLLRLAGCPLPEGMPEGSLLGAPPRDIVAVTNSAGALRWAWRRGGDKVVFHAAAQSAARVGRVSLVAPGTPEAVACFRFDLASDPREERTLPVDGDLALAAADAFAASAGRLVPGLQVLAVGGEGDVRVALDAGMTLALAQAFALGPVGAAADGTRLEVVFSFARPFALAALGGSSRPQEVEVAAGGLPVRAVALDRRPEVRAPGVYVWWNDRDPVLHQAQDETMRRLKSLGYVQ